MGHRQHQTRGITRHDRHDMMLLENQIPMLVLERLLVARANMILEECVLQFQEAREELHEQILLFISWGNRTLTRWGDMYFHVLDLHRNSPSSYELGTPITLSRKLCLFIISTFLIKVHGELTKGEPSPFRCLYRIIYCLLSPVFLVNLIVSRIRSDRLTRSRLGWLRQFPISHRT
ncbi:hypothetical protein CDL12_00759 [Handroanthus impetiginosus]|uniref:Uncharacterized protein n=1 Tax=Handroanthus impetiginosus TaxID=429701 RepID=A0A2G9I9Q1_9LAMI|nr:hypothetical protein CDL12_00759 [Handroanthus impetiginosus]